MKLYILKAIYGIEDFSPWFDKSFGHLVRAESEIDARAIASRHCGDEGVEPWLNESKTTCEELTSDGEEEHLMVDFALA